MNKDNITPEELDISEDQITLSLDDGTEILCDILAIFPCGDKDYIALLPVDSDEDGEVYLYGFVEKEDGEVDLIDIEDDDEFDAVSDAFEELLDDEEFEELYGDEDDEDAEN